MSKSKYLLKTAGCIYLHCFCQLLLFGDKMVTKAKIKKILILGGGSTIPYYVHCVTDSWVSDTEGVFRSSSELINNVIYPAKSFNNRYADLSCG